MVYNSLVFPLSYINAATDSKPLKEMKIRGYNLVENLCIATGRQRLKSILLRMIHKCLCQWELIREHSQYPCPGAL